jgi:hypothetical protein
MSISIIESENENKRKLSANGNGVAYNVEINNGNINGVMAYGSIISWRRKYHGNINNGVSVISAKINNMAKISIMAAMKAAISNNQ